MELLIGGIKEGLEGPAVGYCLLNRVELRLGVPLDRGSRLVSDTETTDLGIAGAETVDCLDGFRVPYRDCVWTQLHKLSVFSV